MYRAVGTRCAVDLSELKLPISNEDALERLVCLGFRIIEVDLVWTARSCIGVSRYRRGARLAEAPTFFDCSSFIKWLYGQYGLWLPRRTIQQIEFGTFVDLSDLRVGDVIFTTGYRNYYQDDPAHGVGHVGFVSRNGFIVHAANSRVGIIESELSTFLEVGRFRGARRFISNQERVLTLEVPLSYEIEVSDDIRWILLQRL